METNAFIHIKDIYKSYEKKEVLKGVSIEINKGVFFGVFGRNGAGKSTLFKIILGLVYPTKGEVRINGEKISKLKNLSIGYLPENISIYGHMNVEDNLRVSALSAGYQLSKTRIDDILEKVDLQGGSQTLAKDLSLGMKRRLQLAMATMTKPVDLLILDEPTNGMDLNGVLWLKKYLKELKKKEITILACSHSLNVMEDLIDEYCIIQNGVIVKNEKWNLEDTQRYAIEIKQGLKKEEINCIDEIGKIFKQSGKEIFISTEKSLYDVVRFFVDKQIEIENIVPIKNSLEEIFIESVNKCLKH